MENNENKVLLKVEHLEQYFKSGKKVLKAVDDVNFEIRKGEVFGLVGESGCGKTTTGRSIIRLYDITGGSVYFDGKRICAGIRPYKAAIKDAKKKNKEEIKALTEELKSKNLNEMSETERKALITDYNAKVKACNDELIKIINENI